MFESYPMVIMTTSMEDEILIRFSPFKMPTIAKAPIITIRRIEY